MSEQKKARKAGRPKLPKGSAKARMLRVRVTPDEHKAIEYYAKKNNTTVSRWIRNTLSAAIKE